MDTAIAVGTMALDAEEEPEKILQVREDEISAPKFVSKEEQERQEALQAEADARAAANAGDNLGERGLKVAPPFRFPHPPRLLPVLIAYCSKLLIA